MVSLFPSSPSPPPPKKHAKFQRYLPLMRGEERAVKFLFSLFFSLFFSLLPNFFGCFSLLPDFSPFSLISLLRDLFYLLLHRSASFPRVLKEGKHTKHVCHVIISRSSHTTFRFCHLSLKLWCLQHLFNYRIKVRMVTHNYLLLLATTKSIYASGVIHWTWIVYFTLLGVNSSGVSALGHKPWSVNLALYYYYYY